MQISQIPVWGQCHQLDHAEVSPKGTVWATIWIDFLAYLRTAWRFSPTSKTHFISSSKKLIDPQKEVFLIFFFPVSTNALFCRPKLLTENHMAVGQQYRIPKKTPVWEKETSPQNPKPAVSLGVSLWPPQPNDPTASCCAKQLWRCPSCEPHSWPDFILLIAFQYLYYIYYKVIETS